MTYRYDPPPREDNGRLLPGITPPPDVDKQLREGFDSLGHLQFDNVGDALWSLIVVGSIGWVGLVVGAVIAGGTGAVIGACLALGWMFFVEQERRRARREHREAWERRHGHR